MRKTFAALAAIAAFAFPATVQAETNYQQAKRIIYATFPDSTQDAALRVVRCETGGTYSPWSYNSSGATGYFQILQGNAGRILHYAGRTLTIPGDPRASRNAHRHPLFAPWTNARIALFLSHGGTDWGEWSCRP